MSVRPVPRSFPVELTAFLAILATGVILVLIGHVSPEALAGYASALAGLHAAWHHRPIRTPSDSADTSPTPAEDSQSRPRQGSADRI
ncbi:hypothetical protein AB0469_15370 [Streptomyces sp. NPDC093801]|uniref:hypothetical protein n=1 Tax=Streptomyces sp. NPDC093801 TaxID=3155203 RepID=UPI00344F8982